MYLRYIMCYSDTWICCEIITTIKLINTCITLHTFFFFLVRTIKIHSQQLSNMQYSVITIVAMLHKFIPCK